MSELDAVLTEEDAKLVTLARGARARIGADQGAAIRDEMGRTYAGATVSVPSMHLSALQLAVASAIAAGARGVEVAVIVGVQSADDAGVQAVRDLAGPGIDVLGCGPDGAVTSRFAT